VPAEVLVSDVTLDSRAATPARCFSRAGDARIMGLNSPDAVARGARAVLYERDGDTGEQPRSCRPARFVAACRSSPSAPAS